ncbi:hypothetical protein RND71_023452 [Anisodus tanguticus]|uniref:Photosystem II cytochrome b559 N-terminal domain-containing protein n=1 Tax=Anisodus tanguticus TaxID=243964 RepID=A0AAE1RVK1_9SOLA|nr:hypothetical protein RND71_023452 [Anisodus tanguticus]
MQKHSQEQEIETLMTIDRTYPIFTVRWLVVHDMAKKDEWDTTTSKDVADIPGNIAQGQVPMSKDWLRQRHSLNLTRKIQELVRARKYYMGLLSSQKGGDDADADADAAAGSRQTGGAATDKGAGNDVGERR